MSRPTLFNDVSVHAAMIADVDRVSAYRDAIAAAVRPGDHVIDVGTGTGILAMLCATQGAYVTAIERGPVAGLARRIVAANGLEDRIDVVAGDALTVDLPRTADVIISEVLGSMGIGESSWDGLLRLRDEALKEGGAFIPGRVVPKLQTVNAPDFHRFLRFESEVALFDFGPAAKLALNQTHGLRMSTEQVTSPPVELADIDLTRADIVSTDRLAASVELELEGPATGLLGTFEAVLVPGITVGNAGVRGSNWMQRYFPLLTEEPAMAGDRLAVTLTMRSIGGMRFLFTWQHRLSRGGELISSGEQSTFDGELLEPAVGRSGHGPTAFGSEVVAALSAEQPPDDPELIEWLRRSGLVT